MDLSGLVFLDLRRDGKHFLRRKVSFNMKAKDSNEASKTSSDKPSDKTSSIDCASESDRFKKTDNEKLANMMSNLRAQPT